MIKKMFNEWRTYNRTMKELNALSHRELNDIGISRGDIQAIARGTKRDIY